MNIQEFRLTFRNKYPSSFIDAVYFVLVKEGAFNGRAGYVNDPTDRGGETKYGISKRSFPNLDIAGLTLVKAVSIYHRNYWRAVRANLFSDRLAFVLFDAAVQHGHITAIKFLQELAGVKQDGIVGHKTAKAAGNINDPFLATALIIRRGRFYSRIVLRRPNQARYIKGWFNRLRDLNFALSATKG
ncbi:glycoside hydrolase family 108 protein [Photobacterium damselae]|uniref:glycoside hydrolase family 108 protein n=1 Tax=Photobacterium damselae TaxID=38293 RepID=UPI001F41A209|nr:N-acetylmuramidase [Photobacterium damselae]UKA12920.1 N-acetylmuramidase [Photobacterium damselae subsp. damselae]